MSTENERYQHTSLGERLGDVVGWFAAHPLALVPIVIAIAGIASQVFWPTRSAQPTDVAVGDCLFIPTSAADAIGPGARPIGDWPEAADVLLRGGAEQASCSSSHGHEVSAILDYPRAENPRGQPAVVRSRCEDAFGAYVGRHVELSTLETYGAMPTVEQWDSGIHVAICLVARRDGQWLTTTAQQSGK